MKIRAAVLKRERLLYFKSVKMRGLSSWAPAQPPARVFYKSATPQLAVAPREFKMNARRNFSEMAFRSGSQPLKFFHLDGVKLEYYRTPCHWCKIPPPGFAFLSIFFLHHRGFVRGFASGAVVFWGDWSSILVLSLVVAWPFSRVFIKCGLVSLYISIIK